MELYIDLQQEPCAPIENWKSALIRNSENENTVPACWVRVGDKVYFKFWINGQVYQSEVQAKKVSEE